MSFATQQSSGLRAASQAPRKSKGVSPCFHRGQDFTPRNSAVASLPRVQRFRVLVVFIQSHGRFAASPRLKTGSPHTSVTEALGDRGVGSSLCTVRALLVSGLPEAEIYNFPCSERIAGLPDSLLARVKLMYSEQGWRSEPANSCS